MAPIKFVELTDPEAEYAEEENGTITLHLASSDGAAAFTFTDHQAASEFLTSCGKALEEARAAKESHHQDIAP